MRSSSGKLACQVVTTRELSSRFTSLTVDVDLLVSNGVGDATLVVQNQKFRVCAV
jgi:hypothetical protein